jgi:tetratricopeptide (TPR) repeat protein
VPTAPPDFTCFDETHRRWVACVVHQAPGAGAWWLERPRPGRYRMHVGIDENRANPRRYPGDYEGYLSFEVTDTAPARLVVDLPRLIRLTRPGDNARSLEGMLTSCATQPRFDTPRYAWTPMASVEVAWEPVVAGAEYRYSVSTFDCGASGFRRQLLSGALDGTAMTLTLPPSAEGEQYVFRVEAWRHGRLVGDFYTHDGGTHSWNYRFRVQDASVPRWVYLAVAAGVIAVLLGADALLGGVDVEQRRRRLRLLAGGAVATLAVAAVVIGGHHYARDRERRAREALQAAADAERLTRRRDFLAAFAAAAPKPAWWDAVRTAYRVDNVGDLLSAWQGHPRTDDGERQFFKAAYQGIVDHPDDEHVVATAIELLDAVVRDYPHRLSLALFGYERYFHHARRTDNCAACMAGDTSQALALNLGRLYTEAGLPDEAIAVCRRLLDERGNDVSPYKLAEIWNQLAWSHWRKGEREEAHRVVREAIERYGATVRGDELRRTLAAFEREAAPATR